MDEQRSLALMAGREVKVDENFYPSISPGDVGVIVVMAISFDSVSRRYLFSSR